MHNYMETEEKYFSIWSNKSNFHDLNDIGMAVRPVIYQFRNDKIQDDEIKISTWKQYQKENYNIWTSEMSSYLYIYAVYIRIIVHILVIITFQPLCPPTIIRSISIRVT